MQDAFCWNLESIQSAIIFQQQLKHVAEPIRHVLPRYPVELPKLKVGVSTSKVPYPVELPKLKVGVPTSKVPYPVSSQSALGMPHQGLLPAITAKKWHSRSVKVNTEDANLYSQNYFGYWLINYSSLIIDIFTGQRRTTSLNFKELLHAYSGEKR